MARLIASVVLSLLPVLSLCINERSFWCPPKCQCSFNERIIDCSSLNLKLVPPLPHTAVRLFLNDNKIEKLSSNDFNGLSHLSYLIISNNLIKALPEDLLNSLSSLQYLIADGNQLDRLPLTLLHKTRHLSTLSLAHNKLSSIPKGLFHSRHQLSILNLQHNLFHNDVLSQISTIGSLQALFLDHNLLTSFVPPASFPAVQSLRLSSNQINTISLSLLRNCSSLEILDLSNNSLENFNTRVLENCNELQKLFLQHNRLTSFTNSVSNSPIRSLYLHGNNFSTPSIHTLQSLSNLTQLQLNTLPCSCTLRPLAVWAHKQLVKGLKCWIPGVGVARITSLLKSCSYRGKPYMTTKATEAKDFSNENFKIKKSLTVNRNDICLEQPSKGDFLSFLHPTTSYGGHKPSTSISTPRTTPTHPDELQYVVELKSLTELVNSLQIEVTRLKYKLQLLESVLNDKQMGDTLTSSHKNIEL